MTGMTPEVKSNSRCDFVARKQVTDTPSCNTQECCSEKPSNKPENEVYSWGKRREVSMDGDCGDDMRGRHTNVRCECDGPSEGKEAQE